MQGSGSPGPELRNTAAHRVNLTRGRNKRRKTDWDKREEDWQGKQERPDNI